MSPLAELLTVDRDRGVHSAAAWSVGDTAATRTAAAPGTQVPCSSQGFISGGNTHRQAGETRRAVRSWRFTALEPRTRRRSQMSVAYAQVTFPLKSVINVDRNNQES